jgi:hypothetical protein
VNLHPCVGIVLASERVWKANDSLLDVLLTVSDMKSLLLSELAALAVSFNRKAHIVLVQVKVLILKRLWKLLEPSVRVWRLQLTQFQASANLSSSEGVGSSMKQAHVAAHKRTTSARKHALRWSGSQI